MIRYALIVLTFAFSSLAHAGNSAVCWSRLTGALKSFAIEVADQAYVILNPGQPGPGARLRAELAAREELRERTLEFEAMPNDRAKFEFALNQFEYRSLRLSRTREQVHELLMNLYQNHLNNVILGTFGGPLADAPPFEVSETDVNYARTLMKRGYASRRVLLPALD